MDVITFSQPDNHIAQRHRIDRSVELSPISLSVVREMPAVVSFPLLFVLFASLSLTLTPLVQQRFGFYRLDRIMLPDDESLMPAMRLQAIPEPDASLLADSAASEIPLTVQSVRYSSYTVRKGDSISGISFRFGIRNISTILSVNKIDNARRIRFGQTLSIPSMDGILYTVVRGDSIAGIAGRYSTPVNSILDANDLSNDALTVGQSLFIPGATLSSIDLRRAMGELFVYPIKGRLTSVFGYRSDPFTGVRSFHTGIDLAAPTGTPIKATLDGRVATTGYSNVYGNYVIIAHDAGYQSLYGHMSFIGVKRGQSVSQGTIIGKVGNTGYSTGSHVHFSVYKNGKMVDPLSVLK